jgi:uncharacterized membrane-anchored protein YjiN (DUF445 family)
MTEEIAKQLSKVSSMKEVGRKIIELLEKYYKQHSKVGFVSGPITAGGSDKIAENIRKLHEYTTEIRNNHTFPIFSSTDIFTDELHKRVSADTVTKDEWQEFWRNIIKAGYITDIFMAPRWEFSSGAIDEHETAQKLGIKIHY